MCGSTPFNSSKSRWIKPHFLYRERNTFRAVDKNCIRYKHNSPAFHLEVNKPHISSPCHISLSVKTQSLHERPSPCQPTVSWAQARFDWDECLQVQNVPKNTCPSNHGVISCLLICHSDIKIKKMQNYIQYIHPRASGHTCNLSLGETVKTLDWFLRHITLQSLGFPLL